MIVVSINDNRYKIPQTWSEITLSQGIAVHNLFPVIPGRLKDIYLAANERKTDEVVKLQEETTTEEALKVFPAWYGDVICAVSDIPQDVMDNTDTFERTKLYMDYCEWIVLGLMFLPVDFEPKGIKDFEHRSEIYKLPEEGRKPGGKLPGAFLGFAQFAQSSDMLVAATDLSTGSYDRMKEFIAILVYPEGDKYDEQKMLKMAESFEDLPMSVVWEVYFFIIRSLVRSGSRILSYSREVMEKRKSLLEGVALPDGVGTEMS